MVDKQFLKSCYVNTNMHIFLPIHISTSCFLQSIVDTWSIGVQNILFSQMSIDRIQGFLCITERIDISMKFFREIIYSSVSAF